MQLPPGPHAASQHGNQQPAKPRNKLELTCIQTAPFQEGNIPLATIQGLIHTRGAARVQGFPLHEEHHCMQGNRANCPCYFHPLCSDLQHSLAEGTLVSVRDAIRAAVRVGLPCAEHTSVHKLSANLQRELKKNQNYSGLLCSLAFQIGQKINNLMLFLTRGLKQQ